MYEKGLYAFVVVFAGSPKVRAQWAEWVHPLYIHGPDLDKLKEIYRWRQTVIDEDYRAWQRAKKEDPNPERFGEEYRVPPDLRTLFIIDDMGSKKNRAFFHSETMNSIDVEGRHAGIMLMKGAHNFHDVHKDSRQQQQVVIVTDCDSDDDVKALYKGYCSRFMDFKLFKSMLFGLTATLGRSLVILKKPKNMERNADNCLGYLKTQWPEPPSYHLGSREWNDYAREHYYDATAQRSERPPREPSVAGYDFEVASNANSWAPSNHFTDAFNARYQDQPKRQPIEPDRGSLVSLRKRRLPFEEYLDQRRIALPNGHLHLE